MMRRKQNYVINIHRTMLMVASVVLRYLSSMKMRFIIKEFRCGKMTKERNVSRFLRYATENGRGKASAAILLIEISTAAK